MWGAATHDRSTGVHRPLTATVLVLRAVDGSPASQQVLIAVDHCLLWHGEMQSLLSAIASQSGVPKSQLKVCFSHTHGAGLMGLERAALPGGDAIAPYLDNVARQLATQIALCLPRLQPTSIVYGYGRCDLAANRDFFDESRQKYFCGYNPLGTADDTLLVARIASLSGQSLATFVNYACHPTTLAWENTRISPDYIGAMREIVETATQVPCFFLQGASADLGPREGFTGELAVADRNGRRLGYAVLATLESLPEADQSYVYQGPVVSGATLAIWRSRPIGADRVENASVFRMAEVEIPLEYRADLPTLESLQADIEQWSRTEAAARALGDDADARKARAMVERATRSQARQSTLPAGPVYPYRIGVFQMGDAVWLLVDGEHYNLLQRELRARFPGVPLVVGTIVNGSDVWYLPDQNSFGKGLYQEEVSILKQGSLERVIEAAATLIAPLVHHRDDVTARNAGVADVSLERRNSRS